MIMESLPRLTDIVCLSDNNFELRAVSKGLTASVNDALKGMQGLADASSISVAGKNVTDREEEACIFKFDEELIKEREERSLQAVSNLAYLLTHDIHGRQQIIREDFLSSMCF